MSTNSESTSTELARRLEDGAGPEYWRSLEELADTPAFQELVQREFPRFASELADPLGRRRFLQLMGASLALAGMTACTKQPAEYIAPYVRQPENVLPGRPVFYASVMPLGGYASGVLVETHEGRPTKIEGNPEHPASLGATDLFAQASILGLYDPDRSQTLTYLGEIRPYSAFLGAMRSAMTAQRALKGAGLRILTETVTSPTLGRQLQELTGELPEARWHVFDPLARENMRAGARLAFGSPCNAVYRLDRADVVLALDDDLLGQGPGHLRYVRDFSNKRKLEGAASKMNRLYVAESSPTLTGAKADHRLLARPSEVQRVAYAVASALGIGGGAAGSQHQQWVDEVVADLRRHRGTGLVVAGEAQPPAVHALAHAMNAMLGNVDRTVIYTDPVEVSPRRPQGGSLDKLVEDMHAGKVDLLVIVGGNPVYTASADLGFAEALQKVDLRVHLSAYNDETSELCHWHVPEAHYLESWSDARAFDGTVSVVQPVIQPLYSGKSAHELLAALTERPEQKAYDLVRQTWDNGREDFDKLWRKALHDGVVPGSALPPRRVELDSRRISRSAESQAPAAPSDALELAIRLDPAVLDGRFANNGWLQELPKPLTKLTWSNAAMLSITTARELGVGTSFSSRGGEHGEVLSDVVELTCGGSTITAPAWIRPDHPDGVVTVHLGYGRTRAGRNATGAGFDAFRIRSRTAAWSATGLQLAKTGRRTSLANTQGHWNMEGRDLVRSGSLERYTEHPSLAPAHSHEFGPDMTMYPGFEYRDYAWGMAIDLNACTGCSACIVACQAENNIPVVGAEQVAAGREMHWLRVDRYFKGDPEHPDELETYFQPIPCQQCENAPCELVCPVAATVHSAEGLNDMVYNRCVGTRYCANNCPYKVRRFNFFLYQDWDTPSLKLLRNPDVTVRSRGVMEKCTFCVQRINRAKIRSAIEDRTLADGEIQTACQAACPAQAISFGNINDATSNVARLKKDERNYTLLPGVNARPRTSYLGAVRNWNPVLRKDSDHGETGGH